MTMTIIRPESKLLPRLLPLLENLTYRERNEHSPSRMPPPKRREILGYFSRIWNVNFAIRDGCSFFYLTVKFTPRNSIDRAKKEDISRVYVRENINDVKEWDSKRFRLSFSFLSSSSQRSLGKFLVFVFSYSLNVLKYDFFLQRINWNTIRGIMMCLK